jgi:hypothetical protein
MVHRLDNDRASAPSCSQREVTMDADAVAMRVATGLPGGGVPRRLLSPHAAHPELTCRISRRSGHSLSELK